MKREIILSGIRPTGRLHIGNYFGALKNFVDLQKNHECYFFIADLHSLNEPYDPKIKRQQVLNLAKDYIAAGLDPKKCTIFLQSDIPEHSELSVILSTVVPVSYLFRMTQFKEKSTDRADDKINAGLLYYPILMAADILLYGTTKVPVGMDQTQHVELARDIAKFFNNKYGATFIEPQPLFTETPKIMSLLEPNKKMSKSLGDAHCIYLDETPEEIKKKISKAVTDTGDGTSQGAKNLLELSKLFSATDRYHAFVQAAQSNQLQYAELKNQLATDISEYLTPFRTAKTKLKDTAIEKILAKGAQKAQTVASKKFKEITKKVGLR